MCYSGLWWRIDGLTPIRALQDLADAVQAKLDRGLTSRVLQSNNDINEVKDLIGNIVSLIEVFEVSSGKFMFSTHRAGSSKAVYSSKLASNISKPALSRSNMASIESRMASKRSRIASTR